MLMGYFFFFKNTYFLALSIERAKEMHPGAMSWLWSLSFPVTRLFGEMAASDLVREIDKMSLEQLISPENKRIYDHRGCVYRA